MGIEELRSEFYAALRARQGELEQVALARMRAISDPTEINNPEYVEGLGAAVAAALAYGIAALERSEEQTPTIPTALLSQARLAARNRVSLDTVLRRYFAGYTLLGDFVVEEAERTGISDSGGLKRLLRIHAAVFDRLLATVADEYNREAERPSSSEERRAEWVERLLAGEPLDTTELAYAFEGCHLGVVGCGYGIGSRLRELAKARGRNLLLIDARGPGGAVAWAWLGGRQAFEQKELEDLLSSDWPVSSQIGIGEPAKGLAGWRFTHRQAAAAFPVAQRGTQPVVRYAEAALVSAALQDDVLRASLSSLYLMPLAASRDGGRTYRRTLRAYFAAQCNVSSTAADLRVDRKTVTSRLRAVEQCLGFPITRCTAELETALRLEEIGDGASPRDLALPRLPSKAPHIERAAG